VSAQADTRRKAPEEGDLNRLNSYQRQCRRRPTPGAKRLKRAISIG